MRDRSTPRPCSGKTPAGVAEVARAHGVPVVLFGGHVAPDAGALLDQGVRDIVCITPEGTPLAQALAQASGNLQTAVASYLA
ncbi:glycerate kinase [Propioniciclava sp.]|uniref:glycerate kinase n=1 Tax=Propioniciclava sp. TaxID=2038686 RepID=UPI0039E3CABB